MATYLQGVTDFIPQIQPFQPDLNFYGNVMQQKQNQYDQNWNALNKMYGQYFYADLTRDKNIEKKEEYLKDIEFNLKRVSGLDLSLEQNVTQATQVFKPFYEDKYLMKDMAWTKNYMNQRGRAEGLKNSNDEKMRGQYWDTGVRYMDYMREEFKNTTDEESLGFSNTEYTPYVNVMDKAMKLAKEANLNVETIDFSKDGRWIIKKKNGEALEEPLQKLFEASLGSDPAIQKMYYTQSVVNRKDYAHGNAAQFNGNMEAAEMDYLKRSYETLKKLNEQRVRDLENQQNVKTNQANLVEQQQENGNVTEENTSYLDNLKAAMGINGAVLEQSEAVQQQLSSGESTLVTSTGFQNPYGDVKSLRQKVDAGMASYLMQKDMGEAAHVFAFRNAGIDMDANPYEILRIKNAAAMERVKARNKGEKDAVKFGKMVDAGMMVATPVFDANGEVVDVKYEMNPNAFSTYVKTDPDPGGATDEAAKDQLAQQMAEHYIKGIQQPMVGGITDMMNSMLSGKLMSEADKNYILNGTATQTAFPLTAQAQKTAWGASGLRMGLGTSLMDKMRNFIAGGTQTNYNSVDEFNKDFSEKGLHYDTDRLSSINKRFAEWTTKNYALMEGDEALQAKMKDYVINSAKYQTHIDNIGDYQDFRKKSSSEIITHLKDNGYEHADLFFDADGEEVTPEEFAAKLRNKGIKEEVLQRDVDFILNGKRHTISNNNFSEMRNMIGTHHMSKGFARPQSGSEIAKKVSSETALGSNSNVTLHKADGTVVKLTGESDDGIWNKHLDSNKKYVSLQTGVGGWGFFGGDEYEVYEVNAQNKESIQNRVGEHYIFKNLGAGAIGGVRSGDKTYESEYDKLAEAVSNTWGDSNVVKAAVPGITSFTDGTGLFTAEVEGIQVLPRGFGSPGNIYMNQTIADINRIDWDGYNNVITNGLSESNYRGAASDEDDDGMSLHDKGRVLFNDYIAQFKDPTSKMKPFYLEGSGVAGGDPLKGAMIIKLDQEFLDKYTSGVNSKGEDKGDKMLTAEEAKAFQENGLVFISDRSNFDNGLFQNLYKDPFESTVDYNKGFEYKHPSGVGGFNISTAPKGVVGEPYRVHVKYKVFDPNTGKYTMQERKSPMTNLTQQAKEDMINLLDGIRQLNIQQQNIYYGRQ
jgi:hypothetical protein